MTEDTSRPSATSESPRYRWQILLMVVTVNLVFGSTLTILVAALKTVADDLGTTDSALAWTVTAPFLALSVGTSLFGKLGDVFGLHRVFRLGAVVTAIGTIASAFATNGVTLIVLRTVAGLGGAAAMPTGMAMILRVFPDEERPTALGWFQAAVTGAPAIGLALGGFIIDSYGWQVVFIFYGIIATIAAVASYLIIKPFSARAGEPIDFGGALALAAMAMAIMFAVFTAGEGRPWPLPTLIAALGGIALWIFLRIERNHDFPLLPLQYFTIPNFRWPLVTLFCLSLAYQGGLGVVPLLLQEVLGLSLGVASALLLFRPGTFSVVSAASGSLIKKRGPKGVATLGTGAMILSGISFMVGSQVGLLVLVIGGLMLAGAAFGLVSPSMNTALAESLPEADLGVASGVMSTAGTLGAAIGLQLFVSLLGNAEERQASHFVVPFAVAIGLAGLSLLAARQMERSRDKAVGV